MCYQRRIRPVIVLLLAIVFAYTPAKPCAAADASKGRYALVIGNSHYLAEESVSGVKDAALMKHHLESLDFEVLEPVLDGDLEMIEEGLRDLETRIRGASAVVVFFAGHGFQNGGKNYLMPIDGTIDPRSAISLERIQGVLGLAPDAFKLVFLDACRSVKNGAPGLNAAEPTVKRTLFAFAAGSGQLSAAGSPDGYSPYSMALLRHLREPGLSVIDLLSKVSSDLEEFNQVPVALVSGKTNDFSLFYLQPPVIVKAEIKEADDSLLVLLNGEVAMAGGPSTKKELYLKAGKNDLELLVYNEKALHAGQTWGRTEGWRYDLELRREDGALIQCLEGGAGQRVPCFKDEGERVPFKDGPRHGKVFTVARAKLIVDLDSPTLSIDRDLTVWRDPKAVWANDQDLLDARSLRDLRLNPADLLQGIDLGPLEIWRHVLVDFLTSGKLFGFVVTDPDNTLFTVRGNSGLKSFVTTCMTDRRSDRIRDLRASVQLALARDSKPFGPYDLELTRCVQEVGKNSGFKPEDMRVWTAVESRRSLHPR